MNAIIRLLLLAFTAAALGASTGAAALFSDDSSDPGYWKRNAEGWFWYQDPPPEERPPETPEPRATAPAPADPADPLDELKRIQEEIDRAEALAVLHPTTDNVRDYLEKNLWRLNQATLFTDVARRAIWQDPSLDMTLKHPVNSLALDKYHDLRREAKAEAVAEIGRTHGLFFFFKGDCPYCHVFGPILRQFSETYGIEVFAISLDGGTLPDWPAPRVDARVAAELGVDTVPAVYLVDPRRRDVIPVGHGVLSVDDLANRIYVLTRTEPGQVY